jgi:ATP-binding cassette subfamily C protein
MTWSSPKKKDNIKNILNNLIYLNIKNYKLNFFLVYFFSFTSSLFSALSIVSLIPLVYLLNNESTLGANEIPYFVTLFENLDINIKSGSLIFLFCFLFFFSGLLKIFSDYFIAKLRKKIVQNYFENCLKQFFNSDWHFFYQTKISKISSAIYKDLEIISGSVSAGLYLFANFSIIIILFIVPFLISTKVTLVIVISSLIFFFPLYNVKKIFSNIGKKRSVESENFSNFFNNSLNLVKIVIVNFKQIKIIKEISGKYNELQNFYVKDRFYNSLSHELLNIIIIIFVFFIFFAGKFFNLFISEIVALIFSLVRIAPYLSSLLIMNNSLASAQPSYHNIEKILKNTSNVDVNWGKKIFNFEREINLNNVNYKYPDGKVILDNINITIKKNTFICFLGPSGCGKSTLIDLLAGLNYPTSGQVFYDKNKINDFTRESFLKKIGYLDSNNDLFPISIKDNLKWVNEDVCNEKIFDAINFSISREFVDKLKDQENTNVGDKATFLSAGQRQRICLSRVIVKNPDILILDEPTSHLDEQTEKKIMENLSSIKKTKTIIMATHNKNLLKFFDEIYEFQKNKLQKIK